MQSYFINLLGIMIKRLKKFDQCVNEQDYNVNNDVCNNVEKRKFNAKTNKSKSKISRMYLK